MKGIAIFILSVLLAGILAGGVYLLTGYLGTPAGYWEAWNAANELINTEYKDTDYQIKSIGYSPKGGEYVLEIESPTKSDEYFKLWIEPSGEIRINHYSRMVGEKTTKRLSKEYKDYIEARGLWDEFNSNYQCKGGVLVYSSSYKGKTYFRHEEALTEEELELNKAYDIKDFARVHGELSIEAEVEEPTFEKIAEILLQVKQLADEKDVPFYTINVNLYSVHNHSTEPLVKVVHFRYEDIYETDLAARAEENCKNYDKWVQETHK